MSTYKIEKLENEPILLFAAYGDYKISESHLEVEEVSKKIINNLDEPVYHIIDLSQISYDFNDILIGSKGVKDQDSTYFNPNIVETIFVMDINKTVRTVFQGFASSAFGNFKPRLVGSLDEAFDYVRLQTSPSDNNRKLGS
ncbi:MAG: hypothetical protein AAFR81_10945 [Chloroflexota bacterium]